MDTNRDIPLFEDAFSDDDTQKFILNETTESEKLIRSKDRVQNHGEVFTPKWMVQKMLSESDIQEKLHDLHATFFEPSAGDGAFLKEILHQKLNYVDQISNKSNWQNNALRALMSIYAIELLMDNLIKARQSMMEIFINHFQAFMQKRLSINTDLYKSAKFVINTNIVQGNTLTYKNSNDRLIEFSHWIEDGDAVRREIFTYKSLLEDEGDSGSLQLSLFPEYDTDEKRYSLIKLTKVYKQRQENE